MYESNNSSRINIRLTPEEKTRIEQLAKMNNLTVKKLIFFLLFFDFFS